MRLAVLWLLTACAGPASVQEPAAPDWGLPEVLAVAPDREVRSPLRIDASPEVEATRKLLASVVEAHARDISNPWAVGHGLLVLGSDMTLVDGRPAVQALFATYALPLPVGEDVGVYFPVARGDIRVEPHRDLMLKVFTEIGVSPELAVQVGDSQFTVADAYRTSLSRTWIEGGEPSAGAWNDTPWTLQGVSAWSSPGTTWQAAGHAASVDQLTDAVAVQLDKECAFIREALKQGQTFQKRGQGIFSYTCGGAHLYQGVAYAVARGFGSPSARDHVVRQIPGLLARLDVELAQVDQALRDHPDYTLILLTQRLKFTGHFLETMHKLAALGLFEPDEAQKAVLARAVDELVATVAVINQFHFFEKLDQIRAADEQVYLDLVGDSAHAVRGLDLATGRAAIRY